MCWAPLKGVVGDFGVVSRAYRAALHKLPRGPSAWCALTVPHLRCTQICVPVAQKLLPRARSSITLCGLRTSQRLAFASVFLKRESGRQGVRQAHGCVTSSIVSGGEHKMSESRGDRRAASHFHAWAFSFHCGIESSFFLFVYYLPI